MTTKTRTLHAVRAMFNDPAGSATHEYLYGDEPTVFTSFEAAYRHALKLQAVAETGDWGDADPPAYHVETIGDADLWDAERIAGEPTREEQAEIFFLGALCDLLDKYKAKLTHNVDGIGVEMEAKDLDGRRFPAVSFDLGYGVDPRSCALQIRKLTEEYC